jgi:hypothetical protein
VKRHGQAALEYLITYGWGFLVIIIVVGALAYFGLFSPSRYIPSRCDFGTQLECADYKLDSSAGRIYVQFRNNFGDDIRVTAVYLFDDAAAKTCPGGSCSAPSSNFVIGKGNVSGVITLTPSSIALLNEGDKVSVPMTITFQRASPAGPLHNVTGEIFATVQ